jgi:hypothetical protein
VKNRQEGLVVYAPAKIARPKIKFFAAILPDFWQTFVGNADSKHRSRNGRCRFARASGIADTAYLCVNLDCSRRNPATGTAAATIIDELTFDRIRLTVGGDETAIKFVFREINCESVSALAA